MQIAAPRPPEHSKGSGIPAATQTERVQNASNTHKLPVSYLLLRFFGPELLHVRVSLGIHLCTGALLPLFADLHLHLFGGRRWSAAIDRKHARARRRRTCRRHRRRNRRRPHTRSAIPGTFCARVPSSRGCRSNAHGSGSRKRRGQCRGRQWIHRTGHRSVIRLCCRCRRRCRHRCAACPASVRASRSIGDQLRQHPGFPQRRMKCGRRVRSVGAAYT